jgi:hypothetical protein
MTVARKMLIGVGVGLLVALSAAPARAQFTPRFSTQEKGPPVQRMIGLGLVGFNLSDATSEQWPVLKPSLPPIHLRIGVAVPIRDEEIYLHPEIEVNGSFYLGDYNPPANAYRGIGGDRTYEIEDIPQWGFSILLNLMRSSTDARTMAGAGFGFHFLQHHPPETEEMLLNQATYFRAPFTHVGIGAQVYVQRQILSLSERSRLMVQGRYQVSAMDGDVGDRTLLLSQFQFSLFLVVK